MIFAFMLYFFAFVLFSWRFSSEIGKMAASGVDPHGDFGGKRDSLLSAQALH